MRKKKTKGRVKREDRMLNVLSIKSPKGGFWELELGLGNCEFSSDCTLFSSPEEESCFWNSFGFSA